MLQENIKAVLQKQRDFFNKGKTKNISFRFEMLARLKAAIENNETLINEALKKDLNKGPLDAYTSESGMGNYHGKHSLETVAHRKIVIIKPFGMDFQKKYPPHDQRLCRS